MCERKASKERHGPDGRGKRQCTGFRAAEEDGSVRLSKLRGRPVVVYFYPKDDTSCCTAEPRDFDLLRAGFEEAGAQIIGISPDSVASHARFRKKHNLTLTLASDEQKSVAEAYGVWVEKSSTDESTWASSARRF